MTKNKKRIENVKKNDVLQTILQKAYPRLFVLYADSNYKTYPLRCNVISTNRFKATQKLMLSNYYSLNKMKYEL